MHPTFTRVPQRSYDALVDDRDVTIDAVMAALAVDPLEAEDAFKLFGVDGIPRTLQHFADRGRGAYVQALETLSQWVRTQDSLRLALRKLTLYDMRIGMWAASQMVREVLPFVLPRYEAPRLAIEAAERWVVGEISDSDLYQTHLPCTRTGGTTASRIAGEAASSVVVVPHLRSPEFMETAALEAVQALFYAGGGTYESRRPNWMRSPEAWKLRDVVADACLSYPVIP